MEDHRTAPGTAGLHMVAGLPLPRPEEQVFAAMLDGWGSRQLARNLAPGTVQGRQRVVRAFATHAAAYPWAWTPQMVDEWCTDLRTVRRLRRSTLRSYQEAVRGSGTGEGGASPCRELAEPNMAAPGAAARPMWSFRSGAGGR